MRSKVAVGLVLGLVGCLSMMWPARPFAQSGAPAITLESFDVRPLSTLMSELGHRLERAITYEDTLTLHPADAAKWQRIADTPGNSGQRPVTFSFQFRAPADRSDASVEAILSDLVSQYNRTGVAGKFKVAKTLGVFHLIPEFVKTESGEFVPYSTPLDVRISIVPGQTSGAEQLAAIRDAVRAAGYPHFGIVGNSANAMVRLVPVAPLTNMTAREALVRLLQRNDVRWTWAMLCDRGPRPSCMVNIRHLSRTY